MLANGDSSRADSGRQWRRAAGFMIQVDGSGGNARHGTGPGMTMAAASPGRLCYDGLFPAGKPQAAWRNSSPFPSTERVPPCPSLQTWNWSQATRSWA
ncbi:hypothetical protein G6F63_016234 [Rhizopus arrhizus]|nr:hypothetical protein G6F63_016234 [Rhizopus arrhizus]